MKDMKRINNTLVSGPEEKFLDYITAKLPLWCSPDFLTLTALASTMLVAAFYMLYPTSPAYLLGVNLCLFVNWFTDSTDGRVARYRNISRPNYGYYVDHLFDSLGVAFIILGIARSGLTITQSWVIGGFLMLLVYIHTYLKTTVFKEFDPSLNKFGPTETRLLLMTINFLILFLGNPTLTIKNISMTTFDYIGWLLSAFTLTALLINVLQTIFVLYNREKV